MRAGNNDTLLSLEAYIPEPCGLWLLQVLDLHVNIIYMNDTLDLYIVHC